MTGKTVAFFKMLRPANCLMMGFAVLTGEVITLEGGILPVLSLLGFITASTLTGSSMMLNDYFDREIDRVNEPHRPIPAGIVKPKESLILAGAVGSVGMLSALVGSILVLSYYVLLIAGLSYLLSGYYNAVGKKYGFLGNLMVSGCVAVPFIYGAFITGSFPGFLLLIFTLMAFLANTGREIIKGIADIEGDKHRGIRTLALKLNPRKAAYVAASFYGLAVAISVLPPLMPNPELTQQYGHLFPMYELVSIWYLPFVTVSCAGFIATAILTVKTPSTQNARKMKKASLLWMILGLLAFLLGAGLT